MSPMNERLPFRVQPLTQVRSLTSMCKQYMPVRSSVQ